MREYRESKIFIWLVFESDIDMKLVVYMTDWTHRSHRYSIGRLNNPRAVMQHNELRGVTIGISCICQNFQKNIVHGEVC